MVTRRYNLSNLGGKVLAFTLWLMPISFIVCVHAQQTSSPNQPAPQVVVGDQTLFPIRAKLGPFSAEERARAASVKLARVVKDISIDANKIGIDVHETSTDILAGDLILTTVTESDATAIGRPRSALVADYVKQIRAAVLKVRSEYTFKSLTLGIVYTVAVTFVLILLLILLRNFSPRLYAAIERGRGTQIRNLKIQSLELLSAARITQLLIQAVRLVRFVVTIVLFYFYLHLVFSFFPWTRNFSAMLLGYVLSPIRLGWNSFVAYVPSLFFIFVVIVFSYVLVRIARFLFREVERGTIHWPGFYPEWAMPTYKIIQFLIFAFALVIMFPYLPGSDSPAFKGVSIFVGVLFSLGSSSAIANVIAGVSLTYTRAFHVGDRVQIADTVGDVVSKALLATHIRTIKNVHITIPNSLILGSHIINFSASVREERGLVLHTTLSIGYEVPWRQVHELLQSAAASTSGILQDPKPFVLQSSLDDFYVTYEINAYTDQPSLMTSIYSQLRQNILDTFHKAGIEIMSPHYHAVRDGNNVVMPETYLPSDYTPPSFRFQTGPNGDKTSAAEKTSENR